MGLDAMILVFWMLGFKPAFSLSSFTFIKRVSSVYLSFPVSSSPSAVIPGSVCCAGRGAGPGLPLGTHLPAFLLLPHFALVSEPLKPQELGPTCQGHGVSGAGVCARTNSDTDPRAHTVGPVFCCLCNCWASHLSPNLTFSSAKWWFADLQPVSWGLLLTWERGALWKCKPVIRHKISKHLLDCLACGNKFSSILLSIDRCIFNNKKYTNREPGANTHRG